VAADRKQGAVPVPRAVVQQAARPGVPAVVRVLPAAERVARLVVPLEVVRVLPAGERVVPPAAQEVVPRLASALRPV
jgi:hypothetical protein